MKRIIYLNFVLMAGFIFSSCATDSETIKPEQATKSIIQTRSDVARKDPYKVEFVRAIGKSGIGVGEFFHPTSVGLDFDNNIYVLDSGTERVQTFDPDGNFIYEFDISNTNKKNKVELYDIAVDKNFRIFISDINNDTIAVYEIVGSLSRPGEIKEINYSGALESKGGEKRLSDVEAGSIFSFVSGNPQGTYKVTEKNIDSIETEKIDQIGTTEFKYSSYGSQRVYINVQFNHPAGIATDKLGNILVADSYSESIMKFNYFNTLDFSFGSFGNGIKQFNNPIDTAVDNEMNIYVVDAGNNRVQKFDYNGSYLTEWGKKGSGDSQFNNPSSIDIDRTGNVYVADKDNSRVQVFNPEGQFLFQFKSKFKDTDEGFQPLSLVVSDKGRLCVLDSYTNVLALYDIKYKE